MSPEQALEKLQAAIAEHDWWAGASAQVPLSRRWVEKIERRVIDAAREYVAARGAERDALWERNAEPLWRESDDPEAIRLGRCLQELQWDLDRVGQQHRPFIQWMYEEEWRRLYRMLLARIDR